MKDIQQISIDFDKFTKSLIPKLAKAQQNSARKIWEDVVIEAPVDEGYFVSSIEVSDTEIKGNEIKTTIGSDMQVISLSGKSYNLGFLLETGTNPHTIYPVNYDYLTFKIGDKWIRTKKVEHPGTRALNFYQNALNKNKRYYKQQIKRAIKESKK